MKTHIILNRENKSAIEEALKEVNAKAYKHAFTDYAELEGLGAEAEERLYKLGLPTTEQGIKFRQQSGNQLPAAYGASPAKTTVVEITREGPDWVLTGVDEAPLFGGHSKPKHALILPKDLEAHAKKAPLALHVAVGDERPAGFSVPQIDSSVSLEDRLKEKGASRDLKQFEKEGFSIVWGTEDVNGITHDTWSANYKGENLGTLAMEEQLHPDDQVDKSDAEILAEFGGLNYFKKEFADEIREAKERLNEAEEEAEPSATSARIAELMKGIEKEGKSASASLASIGRDVQHAVDPQPHVLEAGD